jgi:hypothetical protein
MQKYYYITTKDGKTWETAMDEFKTCTQKLIEETELSVKKFIDEIIKSEPLKIIYEKENENE